MNPCIHRILSILDRFCSNKRRLIFDQNISLTGRPELAGIVGDDASAWLNGPLQSVESRSKTWIEETKENPEYNEDLGTKD